MGIRGGARNPDPRFWVGRFSLVRDGELGAVGTHHFGRSTQREARQAGRLCGTGGQASQSLSPTSGHSMTRHGSVSWAVFALRIA
jgi:hypothetical protein